MPPPVIVRVGDCPRCRQSHRRIAFKPLRRALGGVGEARWSYWSVCPDTSEPLVLRLVARGDGTAGEPEIA